MSTATKEKMTEKEAIELVKSNGYRLEEVPVELRTAEVVKVAISHSCNNNVVKLVPKHLRTFNMILNATSSIYGQNDLRDFANRVLDDSWGISVSAFVALANKGEIPNMKKVTDDSIKAAVYKFVVKKDSSNFRKVPVEFVESVLTKDLALRLLKESERNTFNGIENYARFTESFKADEDIVDALQKAIVENASKVYAHQLSQLNPDLIEHSTYKALVEAKGDAIQYLPEDAKTMEICEMAVKQSGQNLKHVPQELRAKFYRDVVKTGSGLDGIPEEDRTDALCTIAVENNAMQLKFVPEDKKSYALCLTAIDSNTEAIDFVPVDKLDEEMMVRFLTSLFSGNYKNDYNMTDEYRARSSQGKKALLQEVFDNYFGEELKSYEKQEKLGELINTVIERDAQMYFKVRNFAGLGREYDNRQFHKFFQGVLTFKHAVIAAQKDISVVGGFSQDVQERVWRFYIQNKKVK